MSSKTSDNNSELNKIEFSDKQIEIFARRILPEVRRFFAEDDVKRKFEEWTKKQNNTNS